MGPVDVICAVRWLRQVARRRRERRCCCLPLIQSETSIQAGNLLVNANNLQAAQLARGFCSPYRFHPKQRQEKRLVSDWERLTLHLQFCVKSN